MPYYDLPTLQAAFTIKQGFDDEPPWSTVRQAIQEIAAVQIDSISVVTRSHHLTLRNRVRNYQPDKLWKALRERQVFETWAHACCVVNIEDYPYYWYRTQRDPSTFHAWYRNLFNKHKDLMDFVEARIRDEGPLSSRDFEDPSGKKRGGFWDWKPAKVALDLLWNTGRIAVRERMNFQRIYDLTERVIPSKYYDQKVDQDQVWRFFLEKCLDCLVASTPKQLLEYISLENYALDYRTKKKPRNRTKIMEHLLDQFEREDKVTRIEIPKTKHNYYVLTCQLPFLHQVQDRRHSSSRVWFISPFDNIVWDRRRVQELFGMNIRLEAYTPPAKREFGYYVMPILWQHHLIGRIDPKADRDTSTLIFRNIELTLPRKHISDVIQPIQEEIERFKEFHHLENLRIEQAKPASLKKQLTP
ncbi:MAG: winged helix-turn-helix domain-containing protein [Promethearchaeota archaeon]